MSVCVLCCIVPQCKWGETKSHSGDAAGGSSHGGIFVCTSNNARTNTPVCARALLCLCEIGSSIVSSRPLRAARTQLDKSAVGTHKSLRHDTLTDDLGEKAYK